MKRRNLTVLMLILAAALLLAACGGSQAEPTATPAPPPTDTPAPAQPSQPAEPVWDRIQASGKLMVGTSVDYPPFEYYDDNFRIDGFDMALIKEIGRRLGLEVDINDIAFEGLDEALQIGQIDVAIAAISVTPEREEFVDFSHIYFVSEDAYVAAQDSRVRDLRSMEDLAGYRVGVQSASIFRDQLEDDLVRTGLMPETDLFVYSRIEDAFDDLNQGRVDVLVMDLPPAELAVQQEGFRLVAQGLGRERYAIAMSKGENTLRTRINQMLTTLQNEGFVAQLAKQYMDIDPNEILPIPTPTPEPTRSPQQPTATPPRPGCIDGMAWVQDLTLDDKNMTAPPVIPPGQGFQKAWRVRNAGTCTWDSSYSLNYVQGNKPGAQMGGLPVAIRGTVAPGQTYDLSVNLFAPLQPGTYQAFWQMRNGQGQAFGERIWVGITVPAAPGPTPAPTATPSPGIQFNADRTTIRQGECVNFSWNVTNVREVYFYAEGQNWQNNGVAGQGSRQVCPTQTTNYYLRVVKNDNSVETRQITITVQPSDAPNIARFTVEPTGQIAAGQCVTLRWDVQGNVQRVNLSRNNVSLWDGAPFRGSLQDCPPGAGDIVYRLDASGPGGNSQATQTIRVVEGQPTPTPAPTSVPQPVIDAFSVNPAQLQPGECVQIGWSTSGGTERVSLLRGGAPFQDGLGLSGSLQDCLSDVGTVNYTLRAANREGVAVTQDASTEVVPPLMPTPTPPPQAPVINFFGADPAQINQGECVNLSWSFTGQDLATSRVFRGGDVIFSDVPQDGSQQDCPPNDGNIEYRLQVDAEFGGSASQSAFVNVIAPQPPAPEPPTITSFSADPPQINPVDNCVTLNWSYTGEGIAAVFLSRNGAQIAGPDANSGFQDCVDPSLAGQDLIYELVVSSESGGSSSQQASVFYSPNSPR